VKGNGATAAILLGVWATFALDVYSTLNSSPQTTELFAGDREASLMYWVKIGAVVAIAGGAIATVRSGSIYPVAGAAGVTLMMVFFYKHAVKRGTGQPPPSNGTSLGW
jgi:hypothetical protein